MLRSFFHKFFAYKHKYPIKIWNAAIINEVPHAISFDGATLRLLNLQTAKVVKSFNFRHINAFSRCEHIITNIYSYERLFFLVYNQKFIKVLDEFLNPIHQLDFDTGLVIISMLWHKEKGNLFVTGTNGWLKCFHVCPEHRVTGFYAEWKLLYEIHSTTDWITSLAYDDFMHILYGAAESNLYAWDLDKGDFRFRLMGIHDKYTLCQVAVNKDSSVVFTSGLDGCVKLWNVKESRCKLLNTIKAGPEGHISFAQNGRHITTIGSDRVIRHFGIGDGKLCCEIALNDPCYHQKPDEVVKVNLIQLPECDAISGNVCVTGFNDVLEAVLLGYAPVEFLESSAPIIGMDYYRENKRLLCLCDNNFIVDTQGTSFDMDISPTNKSKRFGVSEVLCFCIYNHMLYSGLKNGGVKSINMRNQDCYIFDDVKTNDSIVYISIVEGLFNFNHPQCGGMNPKKTKPNHPYIFVYTESGKVDVWCSDCRSHLLEAPIEKTPFVGLQIISKDSQFVIASNHKLTLYKIDAYHFNQSYEVNTNSNQTITAFFYNNENNSIMIGTCLGEIMVFQIENDSLVLRDHYIVGHYVFKIFNNIISLKDGTILVINYENGNILSTVKYTDAEPLSFAHFRIDEEDKPVGYLVFGNRVRYIEINIPEIIEEEEEAEEEKPEPVVVEEKDNNDEDDQNAAKFLKYFDDTRANIQKLMHLFQAEKQKRKRKHFIPEAADDTELPKTPAAPVKKRKPTYEEVMARNAGLVQKEKEDWRPKKKKTHRASTSFSMNDYDEIDEDDAELVIKPFSYASVPIRNEYPLERTSPTFTTFSTVSSTSTNFSVTDKSVVYSNDQHAWAAVGDSPEDLDRTTPYFFPTQSSTYMVSKEKPALVRAPVVVHEVFMGPPPASRVLFNDPNTLNGLSFFDPRGFKGPIEEEKDESVQFEEEDGSILLKNEEEEEDVKENVIIVPQRENPLITRRNMKKHRVSIMQMMSAPSKPKKELQSSLRQVTSEKPKVIVTKKLPSTPPLNLYRHQTPQLPTAPPSARSKTERIPIKEQIKGKLETKKPQPQKKEDMIPSYIKKRPQSAIEKQPKPVVVPVEEAPPPPPPPIQITTAKPPIIKSSSSSLSVTSNGDDKRVKFNIPSTIMQSESKLAETSSESSISSIDIGINRNSKKKEKRKLVDQPVMRKTIDKKSEYVAHKISKPSKYEKMKPVTPPHKSKNENDSVKAAMMSPRDAEVVKEEKKRSRRKSNSQKSDSSAPSELSVAPPIDNEPEQVVQSKETETKTKTAPNVEKKDTTQQPEPVRRKRRLEQDNMFDLLFSGHGSSKDRSKPNSDDENRELFFPFLPSLSNYWQQKVIYPCFPLQIEISKPRNRNAEYDYDAETKYPDTTPRPFAYDSEDNLNMFMNRFKAFMDYNQGVAEIPDDSIWFSSNERIKENEDDKFLSCTKSAPKRKLSM